MFNQKVIKLVFNTFFVYYKTAFNVLCFFQSSVKLFSIGFGLQLCLKFLLQINKLMKKPQVVFYNMFQPDSLKIGAFFAGFGGVFRVIIYCTFVLFR